MGIVYFETGNCLENVGDQKSQIFLLCHETKPAGGAMDRLEPMSWKAQMTAGCGEGLYQWSAQ